MAAKKKRAKQVEVLSKVQFLEHIYDEHFESLKREYAEKTIKNLQLLQPNFWRDQIR